MDFNYEVFRICRLKKQKSRIFVSRAGAFSLLELLVSVAVLVLILGVVLQFTDQTSKIWRGSMAKIQSFQEARAAFEAMTRMLAQATLNTYYDYYDGSNQPRSKAASLAGFVPVKYDRISDLHFISGQASTLLNSSSSPAPTQTHGVFFQAPRGYSESYQGLDNALNACGYFLKFGDDGDAVPDFIQSASWFKKRYRFRLMEMIQPTEKLSIFQKTAEDWFAEPATTHSRVIAENVIACVLLPKLADRQDDPAAAGGGVSLAPNYNYNSRVGLGSSSDPLWPSFPPDAFRAYPTGSAPQDMTRHHQLPPVMRVAMVVIDEASAARIQGASATVPAAIDFTNKGLFEDAKKLDEDLQAIEDVCNAKSGNVTGNTQKLNYRIFRTDILIRQAKWSNK